MTRTVLYQAARCCVAVVLLGLMISVQANGFGTVASWFNWSRGEIVREFGLSIAEARAYDTCRFDLRRIDFKYGGEISTFCGCFAKRATTELNDAHKVKAVRYYAAYVNTRDASINIDTFFPEPSYAGNVGSSWHAAETVRRNGNACYQEGVTDHERLRADQTE